MTEDNMQTQGRNHPGVATMQRTELPKRLNAAKCKSRRISSRWLERKKCVASAPMKKREGSVQQRKNT